MAVDPTQFRVPRNFKLLDELEKAEKGHYEEEIALYGNENVGYCSVGLASTDDCATFTKWNCTIIPQQGQHIGGRIYNLTVVAGPQYPFIPPYIKFVQRVNMPFVSGAGEVNLNSIPGYMWDSDRHGIIDALVHIRINMSAHSAACAQIPENSTFPGSQPF